MSNEKLTVSLTSYNMGDVTPRDFEMWREFLEENIERMCGFDVEVNSYAFGVAVARDYVSFDATNEQEDSIRRALIHAWDDFCAGGWDAAYKKDAEQTSAKKASVAK